MTISSPPRRRGASAGGVLKALRDEGPVSRTRLAGIIGLSPTTITKTVTPMVDAGLLTERVDQPGGLGRPALTLTPVPEAVTVAGVQIGVGKVRLGLADAAGTVRATRSYAFDPAQSVNEVMDDIAENLRVLLADDDGAACIGIGVGAPGPVDRLRRRNVLAINLGWHDVPVSDLLEARLGLPVVVDHNVRSFAMGEARYADHSVESLAYIYVRTGVGFGLAVRGAPFYGGPGNGGESYLGHLRVVEDGLECSCGASGCLETVVAEPYLAPRLEGLGDSSSPDAEMMNELHRLTTEGNGEAIALETDIVEHLAEAVATIVNLFTPELVLVGGMLSSLPPSVLDRLHASTQARIFPLLRDSLRIETADGTDESLIRGAAAIALEVLHYS